MKPQENHKYEAAADKDPNQISQATGVPVSESNPTLNSEPDRMFNRDSESQFLKLQKMSDQQAAILDRTSNQNNRCGGKQVPFALLLPVLLPQIDKDRAMQLQTLFIRVTKNEITKDDFVRLIRGVVGDQMLRLAVSKVLFQSATYHVQLQTPPAAQQLPPRTAPISAGATNLTDRQSFAQLHQKGANSSAISNLHLSAAQGQPNTGYVKKENSEESSQEVGRQSTGNPLSSSISGANQGTRREQSSATIQGLEKPTQQQIPCQQKAFSMYGTGSNASNYDPSSGSSITTSTSSFKSPSQELQMRQVPQHRIISAQLGGSLIGMNMGDQGSGTTGPVKDDSSEKQSSKMGFTTALGVPSTSGNALGGTVSPNITTQVDSNAMLDSRNPSITVPSRVNRTPPKKPSAGQKKPLETVGASPPSSSKQQKLVGAFSDQSIEHLNDVTAVRGVNIREEEEQLFSGVKDDLRVSEASRRVGQEEEERLILQKTTWHTTVRRMPRSRRYLQRPLLPRPSQLALLTKFGLSQFGSSRTPAEASEDVDIDVPPPSSQQPSLVDLMQRLEEIDVAQRHRLEEIAAMQRHLQMAVDELRHETRTLSGKVHMLTRNLPDDALIGLAAD